MDQSLELEEINVWLDNNNLEINFLWRIILYDTEIMIWGVKMTHIQIYKEQIKKGANIKAMYK